MTLRGSERKFWLMSETQEGNLDEWASDRERERKTTKWVRSVPEMKHMSFFFCFRSPFGRGRRCIKKTVPFPCPQVFIFVHCRLVSQCNAPPITSHSFAPTPHPSRPSAHAPNTLWLIPVASDCSFFFYYWLYNVTESRYPWSSQAHGMSCEWRSSPSHGVKPLSL